MEDQAFQMQDTSPILEYKNKHWVQAGLEPGLLHLTAESVFFDKEDTFEAMIKPGTDKKDSTNDLNKGRMLETITRVREANEYFRWFFISSSSTRAKFTIEMERVDQECTLVAELNGDEVARISVHPESVRYEFESDISEFREEGLNNLGFHILESFHRSEESAFTLRFVEVETIPGTQPEDEGGSPFLHVVRTQHKPNATHVKFRCSQIPRPTAWVMGMKPLEMRDGCFCPMGTPGQYMGYGMKPEMRPGTAMVYAVNNYSRNESSPPVDEFSQILVIGHPKAEFGGYSHEGTGVKVHKFSGDIWAANKTNRYFTALVQTEQLWQKTGGAMFHYNGFWFDEEHDRWRLYADFDKFRLTHQADDNLNIKTFIEVLGGPNKKRTGHLPRKIEYEPYAYTTEKGWKFVDQMTYQSFRELTDKHRGVSKEGRFWASTGGLARKRKKRRTTIRSTGLASPKARALELVDQIMEPVELPTIKHVHVEADMLLVTVVIPRTPHCLLGDKIDPETEEHTVELHMGPVDLASVRRKTAKLKKPTRYVIQSNWPVLYEHDRKLVAGTHKLAIPLARLEELPSDPDTQQIPTSNIPEKTGEGQDENLWFVKLYIGNSVMQMVSRLSSSVHLP